jgi:hypothetical protein
MIYALRHHLRPVLGSQHPGTSLRRRCWRIRHFSRSRDGRVAAAAMLHGGVHGVVPDVRESLALVSEPEFCDFQIFIILIIENYLVLQHMFEQHVGEVSGNR